MVKDSGGQGLFVGILFLFFTLFSIFRKAMAMKKEVKKSVKKDVIAHRKSCKAKGTGLSHYILMDKKAK
jgi:modified peptide precursor CbpA